MKKCLFLLTLLIIGMGVVGCSTSVPLKITSFPHIDGNSWEYRSKLIIGTSETIADYKYTQYFDKTATLSNGLVVQRFVITQEASAQMARINSTVRTMGLCLGSGVNYCYVSETGVYGYGSEDDPTTEATLLLPLPLQVGGIWRHNASFTYEAIAEEQVIVPAGTFNAIKVALKISSTTESSYYMWYVDGVGVVKTYLTCPVWYFENGTPVYLGEGKFVEELVSKNF